MDRVHKATRAVLDGRAAFERDGFAFTEWEPEWLILLALARAAARVQGAVRVLDVGGALGGTYLRAARVMDSVVHRWSVVEQDSFVERAKAMDLPSVLTFSNSLLSGLSVDPDLVIFGSSLQYLDAPESALRQIVDSGAQTLALTRTPMAELNRNEASVEHVPARFGQMSYPMWILSRPAISSTLATWKCLFDKQSLGGHMQTSRGIEFEWRDVLWERLPPEGRESR